MKRRKLKIKYPKQRQMLNGLSFNLNYAVKAYRKLLQLANEIQESLLSDPPAATSAARAGKIERILKIASQQAKLARKLRAHEEARTALIEKLVNSLALPKKTLSLSQLISMVPEPYATNYATLRNELHSLISKLDTLCFQNSRLISSNIKYIDEMLSLLANLSRDSDSTYINTGEIDNSQYSPQVLDYNF